VVGPVGRKTRHAEDIVAPWGDPAPVLSRGVDGVRPRCWSGPQCDHGIRQTKPDLISSEIGYPGCRSRTTIAAAPNGSKPARTNLHYWCAEFFALPAITRHAEKSQTPYRCTVAIISGVYRSPATFSTPKVSFVSFRSASVSCTASAPMLSSRYFTRFVPGIGIMSFP
jgi:hypothetical protein